MNTGYVGVAVLATSIVGGISNADDAVQTHKVMSTTADRFDALGGQVDVSGELGIAGAEGDSSNGSGAGAAYIFDLSSGVQLHKLLANDGNSGDVFGIAVSIDGELAVVGALLDDDLGNSSGSAYVFDAQTGLQTLKLNATDGASGDRFGASIAISGNLIVVGAPEDQDNGPESGSAYVFDATSGMQLHKLLPNDGDISDDFGISVAIDGNLIVVGSWQDDDNGNFSGSAYLFDATTGQQLSKVLPTDGSVSDLFGRFVGIDGTTVIVGAHGAGSSGAAYLFDVSDEMNPTQVHKLTPSSGVSMSFGWGVDVSGGGSAIGALQDTNHAGTDDTGSAYLFDTATGQYMCKLVGDDSQDNDNFGSSVAIDGETLFVGSYLEDTGGTNAGAGYVFSVGPGCPADLNGDGMLNFLDISAFLAAFSANDPIADFVNDGMFNFLDVSAYLAAFSAGCP